MKNLAAPQEPDALMLEYNEQLYKINKQVTLKKGETAFDTVITGVTPEGKLMTVDAQERQFDFGEVEWVL